MPLNHNVLKGEENVLLVANFDGIHNQRRFGSNQAKYTHGAAAITDRNGREGTNLRLQRSVQDRGFQLHVRKRN